MPMNKKTSKLKHVKNLRSGEVFITSPKWDIKTIDGVEFLQVKKTEDSSHTYLMRKDGLEFIK